MNVSKLDEAVISDRSATISKMVDRLAEQYNWDPKSRWIENVKWRAKHSDPGISLEIIGEIVQNQLRPGAYAIGDSKVILARYDDRYNPHPLDACAKAYVDLRDEVVNSTIDSIVISADFTWVNSGDDTLCVFAGCGRTARQGVKVAASNAAILIHDLVGIKADPNYIVKPEGIPHLDLVYTKGGDGIWTSEEKLSTRVW